EVTPRAAVEIEDREWRLALDMAQQFGDVLADVVVAGALPERFGALVVVGERRGARRLALLGCHARESGKWQWPFPGILGHVLAACRLRARPRLASVVLFRCR